MWRREGQNKDKEDEEEEGVRMWAMRRGGRGGEVRKRTRRGGGGGENVDKEKRWKRRGR